MNFIYIANARMPTEKAHGVQIVRALQAFIREWVSVRLVVPRRRNKIRQSVKEYYGLSVVIPFVRIPVIDLIPLFGAVSFWIERFCFSLGAFLYIAVKGQESVIYGRDEFALFFSTLFPRQRVVYEMHDFPEGHAWFWKIFFRRLTGIVVTNDWKRERLIEQFDVSRKKIHVARNAVDVAAFRAARDDGIREQCSIPNNAIVAGYAGQLRTKGEAKGVEEIFAAAKMIAAGKSNIHFLFIGGIPQDVALYKGKAAELGLTNTVHFTGQVSAADMPRYLAACDVLLMPFPDTPHYRFYMSPIKMFEYMAAEKPIIATQLPSITEVLDDTSAYLVPPGDIDALASAIEQVIAYPEEAKKRAHVAAQKSTAFTWESRAKNIIAFLSSV